MIRRFLVPAFLPACLSLSLFAGCSTSNDTAPTAVSAGEGPAPGAPDASVDAGPDAFVEVPVWKETSVQIAISSSGYWEGATGYAKDRADMSDEQLTAVAGLRTIQPRDVPRPADGTSIEVRVTDQDGSVATFRAEEFNVPAAAGALPTIDYDTLKPFLATIQCLAAHDVPSVARTTEAPVDPAGADVSSAVALPADTGCVNGVFVPYQCSDSFLTFDVQAPTTYDIVSGRCLENLSLRIYSNDRTTLLATSVPGSGDACFTLRHTFDVGRYLLVMSKTNAAGCSVDGKTGDTSLRIQKAK
ncbi:hypothetical protein AKJ09_06721 [Labilithrix luteola]|uniref:Lipoprotein n=1 Tax=Labilithrix luteola TaxID=1391654 RepID=A0A0K1Q2U8_9BACT|nr:hypothetical protein [Labilithrix luteola]AKV00058.1 hypothetical protein AKJ09_06721 [Labilithrix luteola]